MHSQIYSGLSLISAILRNFRVAGENGFLVIRVRKVRTLRTRIPNSILCTKGVNWDFLNRV